MKQEEKFEIAVAAFEALLAKRNLWRKYYANLDAHILHHGSDEIYTDWKEWAKRTPIHKWIKCAFVWNDTPQGYNTWRLLDYAWLTWNCDNFMH